jgi:hypothetical protein
MAQTPKPAKGAETNVSTREERAHWRRLHADLRADLAELRALWILTNVSGGAR